MCDRPANSRPSFTCPRCWRSDRERIDEYALLNVMAYRVVIACADCATKMRRAGDVCDYIGPVAA